MDLAAFEYHPIVDIPFDFDRDGNVDADDRDVFAGCAGGPATTGSAGRGCTPEEFDRADTDDDLDVDQADFGRFQRCGSGAGSPADPHCSG